MSFEIYCTKATSWLSENASTLTILTTSKPEQKIIFEAYLSDDRQVQFCLTCPNKENLNWHLSSDQTNTPQLTALLQYVSSEGDKSIESILDKAAQLFSENSDASSDCDEVDDSDDYFDDLTVETHSEETFQPDDTTSNFFQTNLQHGSKMAVSRLIKDMKALQASSSNFGIEGHPKNDNLFLWEVTLKDFPDDSNLSKDLKKYAQQYNCEPFVQMELMFPEDYPMAPPFARIIKPRFQFLTGHVTIGGSLCMEMLTKSGWRPTNDIEAVLVQIRAEIISDGNARLDQNSPNKEYTESEAKTSFERMVKKYGWN